MFHPNRTRRRRSRGIALGVPLVLAFSLGLGAARAEVSVRGSLAALEVSAKGASLADVLSALAALKVQLHTPIALEGSVDGVYHGELGRVLLRLLRRYDFIVVRKDDAAEITIIGPGGAPAPSKATGATNSAPAFASVVAPPTVARAERER